MIIKLSTPFHEYVCETFQALTDALVPQTPPMQHGSYFIDSDMNVHEYVIHALNHEITIQQQFFLTPIPLAYPTALMLDSAAAQLIAAGQLQTPSKKSNARGAFSSLLREDRIRVLAALEELSVDVNSLPSPYTNNAGMVKYVTDALNRLSLFGYYSEWSAYGTTRLLPPDKRRLQFFPLSWQQVGYPGVSLGYRDFRGFLMKMPRNEENA
ncbi:gluconate 2-dehydrogenase subunit 3 family protein [Alkalihalobacillus oceani]|uniref:Gluconate 2-dehydrogenase subunit 3 family protein n=1 Tax=Halalkalibacter oceani TaxID=1653776 RepID=A0A9X2IQ04_9BACI|nr:gluconate 2-dehydrogenase subunit 3 family protein [Halalkalibacter oceani]MCM3714113.1 gluconate 2-dehydrogenase subunit 3 family protein [Halalkalibacter oceani]